MGSVAMIVKPSPNEELPEELQDNPSDAESFARNFLIDRCLGREQIIKELSQELIAVRNNYEEVLRRLNKYEPTEELPEAEYDPYKYDFMGR